MRYTALAISLLALTACTPEDDTPGNSLSVPTTYSFERGGESTVSFSGQIARQAMLAELSATVKSGVDQTLDYQDLVDMYENNNAPFSDPDLNTSGKSLSSKTSASPKFVFDQGNTINWFKGWLQGAADASATSNTAADGTAGVVSNTDGSKRYLVDERGVEYIQVFEKGLMGAVMLDQTVNNYLTDLKLDVDNDPANGDPYTDMEHHWDEGYGYFTLQQDLELDPSISQNRGLWSHYMVGLDAEFGVATDTYYAFRKGRAAIVAQDYDVRDAQIPTIVTALEEACYLKALGYLNKGANFLTNGDAASGFHALSEGIGFLHSLRYAASETVSPAKSDEIIETLISGNGFWAGDIQTRIENVKTELQQLYGLSEEVTDGSH